MFKRILAAFAIAILNPRWVVNANNELGIRVMGVNMWYHKWETPLAGVYSDEYSSWRYAEKREFGETITSKKTIIL